MKKLFSLALLLCAAVQGTWAELPDFDGGDGSANHPYLISNATQWNQLSSDMAAGGDYNRKYFQLNADITVSTMIGTQGNMFDGNFDGNGHTLTLNYNSGEQYCAPFRYITGASFSNLTVKGTIYTSNKFAAGIAGEARGVNAFSNCISNVAIYSTVSGDGTHGGFVANNQGGSTTFNNCAFTGAFTGSSTNSWGGFVGWTESDNSASVRFNHCLFHPSNQYGNSSGSATFSRGRDNNTKNITIEDSYYITALGTSQGNQGYLTDDGSSSTPLVGKTIAGINFFVEIANACYPTADNITATSATISWDTMEGFTYQLRYRTRMTYSTSFEDNEEIQQWNSIDADGDGIAWLSANDGDLARTGKGCLVSQSWASDEPLNPDNWLISPQLNFGSSFSIWMSGRYPDPEEHFAIYLSLDGNFFDESNNEPLSTTKILVHETVTSDGYQEYTADLSEYDGQKGYIGIRHFNSYGNYQLLLDDFTVYGGDNWMTIDNATSGTTITGLQPNTEYEYQVAYTFNGKTYTSPIGVLTTMDEHIAPFDVNVTNVTSNTATVNWTAFAGNYNLRYFSYDRNFALVTLNVPSPVWGDGTGYQMLLDADHNTYGSVFPESGPLNLSGDVSAETYANFEFKIPENADGALYTNNIIVQGSIVIEIPAGTYDWCITNPSPGQFMWIVSSNGNISGRADDFEFEPGMHYTFTVTEDGDEDRVDLTVGLIGESEFTTVNGISNTSYTLSDLEPSTNYLVQVQSNKDNNPSEWVSTTFTTADATSIGLLDNADNSQVIDAHSGQVCNVTLIDRTLYKDGFWNTLCLPFDVTDGDTDPGHSPVVGGIDGKSFTGTLLEGAEVMGYDHSEFESQSGTLELVFAPIFKIQAGEPVLIRWSNSDSALEDLVNPVFSGVTIDNSATAQGRMTIDDDNASFVGTYAPISFGSEGDNTVLYLGDDNTFNYPSGAMDIGAFRAYFQLNNGLTAGEPISTDGQGIKAFVLNFGEETGIRIISDSSDSSDSWYTIDGIRLGSYPAARGLCIHRGLKVLIK